MKRARTAVGLLAGLCLIAACDDPFDPGAQIPVRTDTLSVFAMTGTSISFPSALDLFNIALTRLDGSAQFDIVFDIDAEGNTVLYPARLVTTLAPLRIGLRDSTAAFETITRAPRGEYEDEEPLVLAQGETAIIEAQSASCQFNISPFIYAKLVVDSVHLDSREIFFRLTTDRNCGFRSFEEGVPRN